MGLKAEGCEIHTRSAFLQGLFFADVNKLSLFFDEVKPILSYLHKTYKDSLQGVLLNYVLQQDFIDVVIMGVEDAAQLEANIKSLENTTADLETLNSRPIARTSTATTASAGLAGFPNCLTGRPR